MKINSKISKILNKEMTIKEFATICGTVDTEGYKEWKKLLEHLLRKSPRAYRNGRVNYILFQEAICELSGGFIVYGGQGNKNPDCYIDNLWCETKSYNPEESDTWTCASSLQASNSGVPKWRKLLKEQSKQAAKDFLFERSYNKNAYYCLAGTGNCDTPFEQVKLIFVTKDTLIKHLKDDYRKLDLTSLRKILVK